MMGESSALTGTNSAPHSLYDAAPQPSGMSVFTYISCSSGKSRAVRRGGGGRGAGNMKYQALQVAAIFL